MGKEGLTAKQCQHAQPREKRYEMPAGGGLYLVVHPSGKKGWALRYRWRGKTRNLTFERGFPDMKLSTARAEAESKLKDLEKDIDPAAVKAEEQAQAAPNSVESVAKEWLARHAKPNTRPKSYREFERILDADVLPVWKDKLVSEITRPDVLRLLDAIVDRGAPIVANRTHEVIRMVFNWAVDRGYLEASPAAGIKPPSVEKSRERVLDPDELSEVLKAAVTLGYPSGPFLRFLVLTAQRRGEVASMKWSDVDLEKALWTLPADATKSGRLHLVPLSNAACELLEALPRFKGEYVWTTTSGKKSINGFSKMKSRMDEETMKPRKKAGIKKNIPDWTVHDIRRTAATLMAGELHVLPHILSAILGHSGAVSVSSMPSSLITKVYNRYAYLDEKRAALQAWSEYVVSLEATRDELAAAGRMRG